MYEGKMVRREHYSDLEDYYILQFDYDIIPELLIFQRTRGNNTSMLGFRPNYVKATTVSAMKGLEM